jgi:DNA-binding NarL/FixJ family response regulator
VVRVAIVDPLPMYRQGAAAVLAAAGHTVEIPADVVTWAGRGQDGVVLLTLAVEDDWGLLQRLRAATSPVVALIVEESAAAGVRAVRAGARSVIPRTMDSATLRRTVEATVAGQSVLPAFVVAALALSSQTPPREEPALPLEQLSWLRSLAAGMTVAQLADRVGYSERAMFRFLGSLYKDMGVSSRVEAILHAQERGWLIDRPES